MSYSEVMLDKLAVVALLFTITLGYYSPGTFFVGCMALAIIYVASEAQKRRRR